MRYSFCCCVGLGVLFSACSGAAPLPAKSTDAGDHPGTDAGDDRGTDAGVCTPLQGVVSSLTRDTYCVTGDVIIPEGVTLDIPAGTTFILMGRYHFGRDPALPDLEPPAIPGSGSIHAIGTADAPIIFRGETPDAGWFGIVVSHSQDIVHLEYVTIRDTYKDDQDLTSRIWRRGGALNSYLNKKGTIIRHSTFINNRAYSVGGALDIFGHGYWPDPGPVEITDSLFENNSCECGIYAGQSDDLCGGGAIRFTQVNGDASLVKISGNVFRHNESQSTATLPAFGGAIGGFSDSLIIGPGNLFDGNQAASGDGALSCSHEAKLGTIIEEVDPSVVFSNNTPDNGCGK